MRGNGDGNGYGEGHKPEDIHHGFVNAMKARIEADEASNFAGQMNKLIGGMIGFFFASFFVPFLIVYAYNGLQPAVWPDISYLPTVAALFVFRTLMHMLRSE